ncbi:MAG: molybdate ABC transporter substrate-binding protein [Deferrisomatales bacterium]
MTAGWVLAAALAVVAVGSPPGKAAEGPWAGTTLEIFAGSASKPATAEVARRFEERTGARVWTHFGGSGAVLAQLALGGRGDVYFPGSSDFMERAKRRGLVDPRTEVRVAYLVPVIGVPRGNPKGIRGLADLARPGLRVGIARPDGVCVGLYGVEILEAAGLGEAVRRNVVNQAESCGKTAQMLALGLVDAVLGWDVFAQWDPQRVESVYLPPEQVRRIGYLPAAVATASRHPEAAEAFLAFLAGPEGREVFRSMGYLTDLDEARRLAGRDTPVGGEYRLPPAWR